VNPHDPAIWTYGMTLMGAAREKNSQLEEVGPNLLLPACWHLSFV